MTEYAPFQEPNRFTRGFLRLYERPTWLAPLAALTCAGAVAAYTLAVDPTSGASPIGGGCALKALTGFDCPGCGGTRAFWYVLHGNLPEAARHHVMAVFTVPFLVYFFLSWSSNRIFGTKLPSLSISSTAVGLFLALWGVFSVLRNLPWAPFTWFYV